MSAPVGRGYGTDMFSGSQAGFCRVRYCGPSTGDARGGRSAIADPTNQGACEFCRVRYCGPWFRFDDQAKVRGSGPYKIQAQRR